MKSLIALSTICALVIGQTGADPGGLPVTLFTQLGIAAIFFFVWQRADAERKDSQARERETLINSTERLYSGLEVLKDAVNAVKEKA